VKLREYLAIPYVIEVTSEESDDGSWLRCAECVELPSCAVLAETAVEAMQRLTIRRAEVIVDMLRTGHLPPVPRAPLADSVANCDLTGGVSGFPLEKVEQMLDLDEDELSARSDEEISKWWSAVTHGLSTPQRMMKGEARC
jgi:predicted RNase H-like HicB family nuclease